MQQSLLAGDANLYRGASEAGSTVSRSEAIDVLLVEHDENTRKQKTIGVRTQYCLLPRLDRVR